MNSFEWDLTKDAAKALISAGTGWALKGVYDRFRTRKARSFWKPFLSKDLRLVVGPFRQFKGFERSGLLGVGDARALAELQRYLAQIGAHEPKVVYADRLGDDDQRQTLISLGGPDANKVTRDAVELIASKLRFGDPLVHDIRIRDTAMAPPVIYVPSEPDCDGSATDYGLILRAPNPVAPDKQIMIIGGSFGHGTLAGTRYVTSPEFLGLPVSKAGEALECLVKTDVIFDEPQAIRNVQARSIQAAAAPGT